MTEIHRIIDYKKLERVTLENGTRYYLDPQGNRCPSVTTILSATSDNSQLKKWEERVGLVEATRVRTEATALGSLMHTHLENYIEEKIRPAGTNVIRQLAKNMADQVINRGLVNVTEIWGIEEALYHIGLYAGTSDLIGIHNGSPAIMDYKTTKKMKTKDMISDYFAQSAAYALAHNEVYNTEIKKIVIFMVSRDLQFKEFIVEGVEFQYWTNVWINRLNKFYEMSQNIIL